METISIVIIGAIVIAIIASFYFGVARKAPKTLQEPKPVGNNQEPEKEPENTEEPSSQDPQTDDNPVLETPGKEEEESLSALMENEIEADMASVMTSFQEIVTKEEHPNTYSYLRELVREAYYQARCSSYNGLPWLYRQENFPVVYEGYFKDNPNPNLSSEAYYIMLHWVIAMQLAELIPAKRNYIYKIGYAASVDMPIFGYSFYEDPNVARLVGSAIYSTMRTIRKPYISAMREELGGIKYYSSLEKILEDESRTDVKDEDFYVDLRGFMASAPGPYAPGYKDRSSNNATFSDEKASNGCLSMDMAIYEHITQNYNLDDQRAVQAIADEEGDLHHLFGKDMYDIGGQYDFNAVFGNNTIGLEIYPEGDLASLVKLVQRAGGSQRGILQHANASLDAIEYGRLRPGCSENQECLRKSQTDDKLNVLTKWVIEDNDGNKETYTENGIDKYYYDEDGHWTNKNVQSPEEYEEMSKDLLYANSYPSGHSSGIWSAAMTLMEVFPMKADLIMRAANNFANSRAVARYHWMSDTIQGRVAGSVINPVCHAASDYDAMLLMARGKKKK